MIHLSAPASRIIALLLATLVAVSVAAPAYADQIADKRLQAAVVQAQISTLDTQAEQATERYDAANDRVGRLTGQARASAERIARLTARTRTLQTALDDRVVEMYRNPVGFLEVLLSARSFDDFNTLLAVLTDMSGRDASTIAQLKDTKAAVVATHRALVAEQSEASRQRTAAIAYAGQVRARLAARQRVLAGLDADVRTLLAQQQAAEAAASRARAVALAARVRAAAAADAARAAASRAAARKSGGAAKTPSDGGKPAKRHHDAPSAPSSGSRGTRAVAWAEKALGLPYEWAADGPDSFDCSGLTMWAYAHVGVSLPHSSAEQIGYGRRVSRSELRPGDLVFFGSPIHHVGMYVGGGEFIEAPYTGANVRISVLSSRGDYAGACRP